MTWTQVLSEARLKREKRCIVEFEGREVLLLRLPFSEPVRVLACENRCTHQNFPLEMAFLDLEKQTLTCPMHRWCFSLQNGQCTHNQSRLKFYAVKLEAGQIYLSDIGGDDGTAF